MKNSMCSIELKMSNGDRTKQFLGDNHKESPTGIAITGDTRRESHCNKHDIGRGLGPAPTLRSRNKSRCEPNSKDNV